MEPDGRQARREPTEPSVPAQNYLRAIGKIGKLVRYEQTFVNYVFMNSVVEIPDLFPNWVRDRKR